MSTFDAALAWAARGFRVFPLHPGTKTPVFDDFPAIASTDPQTIAEWWIDPVVGYRRSYNVGVDCTGFAVVDLDVKNGRQGVASFLDLDGAFDTLTVRTPTGGLHVYYSTPRAVANSQGEAGGVAPGLDVRAHHGYVLAPGSVIDGKAYEIAVDLPIGAMPDTILERTRMPGIRAANADIATTDLDTANNVSSAIAYLETVAPAVWNAGGDLHTVKVAMAVRDRGISEHICFELMLAHWNERCEPSPWPPEMLRVKVTNAYAYAQDVIGAKSAEATFDGVSIPAPEYIRPLVDPSTLEVHADDLYFGNITPLRDLKPRPWVLRRFLMRGEVGALIAPGGVGKSQLALTAAAHLAMGLDLWGYKNAFGGQPKSSVVYNAEDSKAEMSMRLYALCTEMGWDPRQVGSRILLVSARDHGRVRLAKKADRDIELLKQDIDRLIWLCSDPDTVMLALDPLAKLATGLNENDNGEMTTLMDVLEHIAQRADVATLLSHHSAKQGFAASNSYAGNADASRGAGAIINSARMAATLSSPTQRDQDLYNLSSDDVSRLVRLDDAKNNRDLKSPAATWLRKASVRLHTGDEIGAFRQADIESYANAGREQMGAALAAHMRENNTATMTMMNVVMVLQRSDELARTQIPASVRTRVERLLRAPIELDDGHRIRLGVDGGNKKVIILE